MLGDFVNDRRLNAFGRFVQQDQRRLPAQAAGDREDLLFAAAEHAGRPRADGREARERSR